MLLQCSVLEGEVQPALDQGSHVLTLEVSTFTRDILRFANTFLKKKKKIGFIPCHPFYHANCTFSTPKYVFLSR